MPAQANMLSIRRSLYRSWAKIRKKITQLPGKDFKVTKPQVPMKQHETIEHYPERLPEQAAAIDLSAAVSSSPRIPQNEKFHRLRRLNLAILNPITILPALTSPKPRNKA